MKIKAKDLTGAALAYAVAAADGQKPHAMVEPDYGQQRPREVYVAINLGPSSHEVYAVDGRRADDIIDREGITVIRCDDDYATDAKGYTTGKRIPVWAATIGQHSASELYGSQGNNYGEGYSIDVTDVIYGRTRREAAMRAYVAWKSGRNQWDLDGNVEVDIPEELL